MELYLGYPVFLWEGLINFSSIIVVGLIIAFITTFYLKKKDESTRVAGVILKKRVNAQHEILKFIEDSSQIMEKYLPSIAVLAMDLVASIKGVELTEEQEMEYLNRYSRGKK
ncbi:hypothetical protein ACOTWN_07935 [Aliarcobacter butzleri]